MSALRPVSTALERYALVPMEPAHLDEVSNIERMSYTNPWPREAFEHEIEVNPFSRPTVAVTTQAAPVPGEIAGYCVVWIMFDHLHVQNVAVHPRHRRAGLARALLSRALDQARARNVDVAFLEVRSSNVVAQTLYASLGFRQSGERKNYYSRPREDALLFRAELTPTDNP